MTPLAAQGSGPAPTCERGGQTAPGGTITSSARSAAGPLLRIGRDGFTGSPITEWCSVCADYGVRNGNDECVWCDTPRRIERQLRGAAQRVARSAEMDRQIELFRDRGMSPAAVGRMVGVDHKTVRRRLQRLEAAT